ncbi:MAG: GNAT family N-acetyltransferase [Rudaea sp.]
MHDDFSIRLARSDDAVDIAAMSRDFIEQGLGWNWNVQRVANSIRQRETNVVVAMAADRLAGFGIMGYRDADAHLMLFAVKPAHRRKGIGTALMEWLESTARTAGIELIWLEARVNNAQALAFYRARGYRTLDRLHRYYSGIEDAVRIGKDLAAAQPSSFLDK